MKVLILSDPNSSHTIKWVSSLAKKDITICLFGLGALSVDSYNNLQNVSLVTTTFKVKSAEGSYSKLIYLASIFKLFYTIYRFKPDIVHAHYATSYGLIGSLVNAKKFIVSVWGNDILTFPKISFLHKGVVRFILYRADLVLATSQVLQTEVSYYSSKPAIVTPFGIDIEAFKNLHLVKKRRKSHYWNN